MIFRNIFLLISILLFLHQSNAQNFINGSFENNFCIPGIDELNLSDNGFDSLMPDCRSFGDTSANLDIITNPVFAGYAQHGNWYVGVQGVRDNLSMKISSPLQIGDTHTLTFYDRGRESQCSSYIDIGVSENDSTFGNLIHTTTVAPIPEYWLPRVFTFTAPNNGQHITLRVHDINCWINIDNFCLDSACVPEPILIMPNVFSPNNDLTNDLFLPIAYSGIIKATLSIYNRWGNLIYEDGNISNGWNGKHQEKDCPDGNYYWIVKYTDHYLNEKNISGNLVLLR